VYMLNQILYDETKESSSPGESHHQALTDPGDEPCRSRRIGWYGKFLSV